MRAQSTLPETESRTESKRKPEGGFCFFTGTQFAMAWTALREGKINLREFRVYFALAEMKNRRCQDDQRPPKFTPREIRKLVGGVRGEREAVHKLLAVGLLRQVTKTNIEFATDPSELRFEPKTLDDTLAKIPNRDRRVPVPRRIVRLIAGGARRTLIATILGHLIRCLFYKHGLCQPKGCVKASWIADVFGISERAVKEQRQHLIALGWLLPQKTPQRTLNAHGLWVAINLAWDGLSVAKETLRQPAEEEESTAAEEETPEPAPQPALQPCKEPAPPPAQNLLKTLPPSPPYKEENKEPLPRGSKNQKPACGGRSGVYNSQSRETGTQADRRPTLRDVKAEDLSDPARLLELHAQAVAAGYITSSEAARLNFFAAANHARVIGSKNPPGLFVRIVRSGLWSFLTQADEDVARVQLRQLLYPEAREGPPGLPRFSEAARRLPARRELSADARFVRDITNVLRQRGVPESSVWRLVNRERPEWTRERWDQAQAELQGTSFPLAEAAVAGY